MPNYALPVGSAASCDMDPAVIGLHVVVIASCDMAPLACQFVQVVCCLCFPLAGCIALMSYLPCSAGLRHVLACLPDIATERFTHAYTEQGSPPRGFVMRYLETV